MELGRRLGVTSSPWPSQQWCQLLLLQTESNNLCPPHPGNSGFLYLDEEQDKGKKKRRRSSIGQTPCLSSEDIVTDRFNRRRITLRNCLRKPQMLASECCGLGVSSGEQAAYAHRRCSVDHILGAPGPRDIAFPTPVP